MTVLLLGLVVLFALLLLVFTERTVFMLLCAAGLMVVLNERRIVRKRERMLADLMRKRYGHGTE